MTDHERPYLGDGLRQRRQLGTADDTVDLIALSDALVALSNALVALNRDHETVRVVGEFAQ